MMTFDIFNLLLFGYIIIAIVKLVSSSLDGKFTREEFVSILRLGSILFVVYIALFSMREYTAYSSLNMMETFISHPIAPNINIDYSVSGITRKEACLLGQQGVFIEDSLIKTPESIRQKCMLEYVCQNGIFPTSSSQLQSCFAIEGYLISLIVNLFRNQVVWAFIGIIILEVMFDVFGLMS